MWYRRREAETPQLTRPARYIRVDRNRHNEVLLLFVQVLEMIFPLLLNDVRVDEAVGVWRIFDEHHRR